MTGSDLGDMRRGHWSQFYDLGWQVYLLLFADVWEFFEWFSSKRGAFQFSSIDLEWRSRKINLTLGHWYQYSDV